MPTEGETITGVDGIIDLKANTYRWYHANRYVLDGAGSIGLLYRFIEWQAQQETIKPIELHYTMDYLRRAIGAGLSIGYGPSFDIDKKSEMIDYIIKSLPTAPVTPEPVTT